MVFELYSVGTVEQVGIINKWILHLVYHRYTGRYDMKWSDRGGTPNLILTSES